MAGNASNWYKPSAGPFKGQAVYVAKGNRVGESRTLTLEALQRGDATLAALAASSYPRRVGLPSSAPRTLGMDAETAAEVQRLLGQLAAPDTLARMVGALPGSEVVAVREFDGEVSFEITHPLVVEQGRTLRRQPDGSVVVVNNSLTLRDDSPAGKGTRMLATQVQALAGSGVAFIVTEAHGFAGSDQNGYYTWPRLGYNAPLPAATRRRLPSALRDAHDLHTLLATTAGRTWWREHGHTLPMRFDLVENSTSRRVLAAYLVEKGLSL